LKAFPNVNATEYYVQHIESSKQNIFACFSRKDIIDEVFLKLKNQSFTILDLSLGCLPLSNIGQLINTGKVNTPTHEISFLEGIIQSIGKSKGPSETVKIGDEHIPIFHVPAFASALGYFVGSTNSFFDSTLLVNEKTNYAYRRIIKKGGFAFLIALFVLLLINFVVFSIQNDKQRKLSEELTFNQSTIEQLSSIKKEIAEKEQLSQKGALGGNSCFSYYADRIAASKPSGIVLQKMQIFPLTLKNKKFDINGIKKDTIVIMGTTKNSLILNDWTKVLQQQKFILHTNITNYTQTEPGTGSFTLEIALIPKKD
jgi:hypothetical protein